MMARLRVWEVVSVLSVLAAMAVSTHAFSATASGPTSAQFADDFEVSDQNKAALRTLLRNASLQTLSDDSSDASEDIAATNAEGQPAGEARGPLMYRILNRRIDF